MWHKEHWGRQGETNASYIHLNCACRIIQGNNGSDQMHLWEQENFIYWRLLLPLPSRRSVASKVSELCNTLCNEVRVFNFYNLLPLISKLSPEAPSCRLHWDHRRWQTKKNNKKNLISKRLRRCYVKSVTCEGASGQSADRRWPRS